MAHSKHQMAQEPKNEADQIPVDIASSYFDGASNDGFVGGAEELSVGDRPLEPHGRFLHRRQSDPMDRRVLGRSYLRSNHKMPECLESIFSVGRHPTQYSSRGSEWVETNLSDEDVSSTSGSLVINASSLAWQSSYQGFEI